MPASPPPAVFIAALLLLGGCALLCMFVIAALRLRRGDVAVRQYRVSPDLNMPTASFGVSGASRDGEGRHCRVDLESKDRKNVVGGGSLRSRVAEMAVPGDVASASSKVVIGDEVVAYSSVSSSQHIFSHDFERGDDAHEAQALVGEKQGEDVDEGLAQIPQESSKFADRDARRAAVKAAVDAAIWATKEAEEEEQKRAQATRGLRASIRVVVVAGRSGYSTSESRSSTLTPCVNTGWNAF